MLRRLEEDNFSVNSAHSVNIRTLLHDLNLPINLFQKMEEMPDDLWPYILDEIVYEAQL